MRKCPYFFTLATVVILALSACAVGGGGGGGGNTVSLISVISAGYGSAAMLLSTGRLTTWGDNWYNQLGDNSGDNQDRPIEIPVPGDHMHWDKISVGGYHMIAVVRKDADRTLWGWGLNLSGQAGFWYLDTPVITPEQTSSDTDWDTVSAGTYHNAALKEDGSLWTWGESSFGALGRAGGNTPSPGRVGSGSDWTMVSAGNGYTLGLRTTTLYAWGRNTWGQLGDGTQTNAAEPVLIGSGWRQVDAGYTTSMGVKTDGTLWAWGGYGTYVCLGNGGTSGSLTPVQVGTDTHWSAVSVDGDHALALKSDGSLWSWGYGNYLLGTGTLEERSPAEVQPGTKWSKISAGWEFCLGVKSGNNYSWGDNGYGQLGIGSNDDQDLPVPF
jgi:alpha-tubulin suppressor-like RCC1 family protein